MGFIVDGPAWWIVSDIAVFGLKVGCTLVQRTSPSPRSHLLWPPDDGKPLGSGAGPRPQRGAAVSSVHRTGTSDLELCIGEPAHHVTRILRVQGRLPVPVNLDAVHIKELWRAHGCG